MTTILCWTFHLGPHSLTCAVEATGSSYEVCVLPHWNLGHATVEHFSSAGEALRRHADIAMRLRDAGWASEHLSTHDPSTPHRKHAHGAALAV